MPVINMQKVNKSYGGFDILKEASFTLFNNQKAALIGRNGSGKTTIFNILVKEISFESGSLFIRDGLKIGYLRQMYTNKSGYTGEQVIKQAFEHIYEIEQSMLALSEKMKNDPDNKDLIKSYSKLEERFVFYDGYNTEERYNKVVNGLSISQTVLETKAQRLSGGELTMIMLAKLILQDPDILLLDEPTNHLDVNASEWLEEYIKEFKGAVLYISHDRYFIDRTADKILYLEQGAITEYKGNYSAFKLQKQQQDERDLKLYERQEREISRLRQTALKMRNYGTEVAIKRAQNIEKRISRMDIAEQPITEKHLRLHFSEQDKSAKEVINVSALSKSFAQRSLFKDISFIIRSGDRVALLGPNGAGKSTLIKILLGQMQADEGIVRRPGSIKYVYLEQHIQFDDDSMSILDLVCEQLKLTIQSARNLLGKFLFSDDTVFKQLSELSGGEKSRLRLLLEMQKGVNLMVLDEPTNHLDIASREELEDSLGMFGGTILFISHDRHFIEKFATRVFEIDNGSFNVFEGGYEYWLEKKKYIQTITAPAEKSLPPKDNKRAKRQINTLKRSYENEILSLEEQIQDLNNQMQECTSDYEMLMQITAKLHEVNEELEKTIQSWMDLQDD